MRAMLIIVIALVLAAPAQAHLVKKMTYQRTQEQAFAAVKKDFGHAAYVCAKGTGLVKRVHCRAVPWLRSWIAQHQPVVYVDWVSKQIYAAERIGGQGTDPWPRCPDPFDGGGSWQDTVNCENGGNWYDSPGYYRCGLQFDPMWERMYGRLCP